ncbi:MAG TPA: PIG-L deacetylase family protein [Chloroflexota bacterium]|jgi:LmbE family N-acetylglucosaminyl deacetylase
MVMIDGPLPSMPEGNSVLVVMAHPDDAEFGCGGTIARWASAGKEINYVLCTSGDKGSSDPNAVPYQLAKTRRAEQINAAHALGARDVVFLSYEDGVLRNTLELRRDIVRQIRRFKPDAVICQDPTMRFGGNRYLNHPDHRAAGDACLDAVYPSARDPHVFPELLIEELLPHKVREVFMSTQQNADLWIDITECFERKLEGLRQHTSQVGDRFEQVVERIKERSRQLSKAQGLDFEYAEGYRYFRLD